MRSTHAFAALALVATTGLAVAAQTRKAAPAAAPVVVYKTATCGCCGNWVTHLREHGFKVEVHEVEQNRLDVVAREAGLTPDLRSCHTAKVDGYAVEGHVPAADIQKLLKEKPQVAGIAVPGMPMGSPGMEQGSQKDPYDTVSFTKTGQKAVFVPHRQGGGR